MATISAPKVNSKNGTCWIELDPVPSPLQCLQKISHLKNCLLLESAMQVVEVGRYSFLMADPVQTIQFDHDDSDLVETNPFAEIESILETYDVDAVESLPPFQGGAAGLLSYELNSAFERIESPSRNLIPTPKMLIGIYDVVIAWDHLLNRCWLISQGYSNSIGIRRDERSRERIEFFAELLNGPMNRISQSGFNPLESTIPNDQFPLDDLESVASNLSESQYLEAVEKIIEYIHAGDIFQANFAQSLLTPARTHSLLLYQRLRNCNPAPFAGFFDLGEIQVLSASPERFVSLRNGTVQTRPIKGTRRRTQFPEADLATSLQLQTSEKDRAENIMIVDLLRNDLSRVCTDRSVEVKKLCQVESFQSVLHLVSVIEGQLQNDKSVFDLLRASFPGGSITGAPKVRAMEIIAELEPSSRGAYCGCLGYIGFDGTSDFNILIRTLTANENWWQIPVGGGIVADSDPQREYEETWTKAAAMLRATQTGKFEAAPLRESWFH